MSDKRFNISKKIASLIMIILMLSIPVALQSSQTAPVQTTSEYVQGRIDGEQAAKGDPLWILGGFLCGLFAVIYCYVQSATPPAIALVGKTSEYILGYTDGYKAKRSRDAVYAWIGWGASWIFLIAVNAASAGNY